MAVINFATPVKVGDFPIIAQRFTDKEEDAQIETRYGFSNWQYDFGAHAVTVRDVDVTINIFSGNSWVVIGTMSPYLLNHEQGHYDIVALSAREVYKKLVGLSAANSKLLQALANGILANAKGRQERVNTRYDAQTDKSRNKTTQQLWDKKLSDAKSKPSGTLDELPR